ncbi:MAG: DinB family protein [Pedobacter sp.]|nr:MAG: DinB family protein [Pedobacter sp.]
MNIIELLLTEMERESNTTRKMLSLVPMNKLGWTPHQKSMTMRSLATHVAELFSWVELGLNTDELDFAVTPYEQVSVENTQDLLLLFEKSYTEGRNALAVTKDSDLTGKWVLRNADEIYATMTKYEIIRHTFSQIIHHRAQLGVYLRLLDIPIPGSYGPSADDPSF